MTASPSNASLEANHSVQDYARPSIPSAESDEPRYLGFTTTFWVQAGIVAALLATIFWPNLRRLWEKTNPIWGEQNWQHAIFIPVVGLYYLYVNRDELLRAKVKPLLPGGWTALRIGSSTALIALGVVVYVYARLKGVARLEPGGELLVTWGVLALVFNWGIGTLLFGLRFFAYGIHPGQNDYFKDIGMVITLFGAVLTMCGWEVMRIAWFPIVFLLCALPWPPLVYSWVASPLQWLAAQVAVVVLKLTGVPAYQQGTKIIMSNDVPPRALNVAEACAGLRSLMTFISLAGAMAFLSNRPLWQKIFITASAVPIAIFCNVMRVSGQGLLDVYVSQKISEGFAHMFVGLFMLMPALGLIYLVGLALDKMFIEEVDDEVATNLPPLGVELAGAALVADRFISVPAAATPTTSMETAPPVVVASSAVPRPARAEAPAATAASAPTEPAPVATPVSVPPRRSPDVGRRYIPPAVPGTSGSGVSTAPTAQSNTENL